MIDITKVYDIRIANIDPKDSPDFSDAFIASAKYEDRQLNDSELDELTDNNPDWFYEKVINQIFNN